MASTFKIYQQGKQIEEITITVMAYQYCQLTVEMSEDGNTTFKQNMSQGSQEKYIVAKDSVINYKTFPINCSEDIISNFYDDNGNLINSCSMGNWYVRRSRDRFWAKGMEQDKINAYMTLYTALVEICKAAAPMIPFMTEEIYQNLVRSVDESAPESIHLCDYPVANEAYIDKTLEENMDEVLKIVVMGRACRNTANIKNRQPIGKMFVKGASDLPEFYQDAYPSFYKNDEGVWVDGFTEDSMKDALERLKSAYEAGYIDKESLTNATSDCRTKFYEDKFGVFTYWAGTWATNLKTNLEANGLDSELVAIPPIEELGAYTERVAPAWCITEACSNPEGVYKYFIESMLDGGDMQFLWTYGVEGVHWSTAAEEVCGVIYEEGQFHMLENREKEGTVYTKNHIDPMLAVAPLENDPKADAVAEEAKVSAETFQEHSKMAQLVVSTDEMAEYNGDLTTLKNEVIAKVVTQGMSVEDGMAYFDQQGGNNWSQKIVDSLNN